MEWELKRRSLFRNLYTYLFTYAIISCNQAKVPIYLILSKLKYLFTELQFYFPLGCIIYSNHNNNRSCKYIQI